MPITKTKLYRESNLTMINLDGRKFTLVSNTAGNAKPGETIFYFQQSDEAVRATYSGGDVTLGAIVGKHFGNDQLEVLFQQVTTNGKIEGGKGDIKIEKLANGKVRFLDEWSYLINGVGSGSAVWEEV